MGRHRGWEAKSHTRVAAAHHKHLAVGLDKGREDLLQGLVADVPVEGGVICLVSLVPVVCVGGMHCRRKKRNSLYFYRI